MAKIAFFPGSFDPITKGHEDIVKRAIPMFDKIIVALGKNTSKNSMFSLKTRLEWVENTFKECSNVKVMAYEGLTINACKIHSAQYILRGIRNTIDFEYEKNIAVINQNMAPDIETIYLNTNPELAAISSTIVREIIKNQGKAEPFLASGVCL